MSCWPVFAAVSFCGYFCETFAVLQPFAEITEELSNLADAIIEFALRLARQDLDNRFGAPLETDERGRAMARAILRRRSRKARLKRAQLLVRHRSAFYFFSRGNDLGHRDERQRYEPRIFHKTCRKGDSSRRRTVGRRRGLSHRHAAAAARLGRTGWPLSLDETVSYYETDAREWERQVLIRSRAIAGGMRSL